MTRTDDLVGPRIDDLGNGVRPHFHRIDDLVARRTDDLVARRIDDLVARRIDDLVAPGADELTGNGVRPHFLGGAS